MVVYKLKYSIYHISYTEYYIYYDVIIRLPRTTDYPAAGIIIITRRRGYLYYNTIVTFRLSMYIIIPGNKVQHHSMEIITNNGTELFIINKTRDINIKHTRRSYITFRYYSLICILRQILQLIVQLTD